MPETLPAIDLEPFRLGSRAERIRVASEVRRACEEVGFLTVRGHGVDEDVLGGVAATAGAFFDLPGEEKRRLAGAADRPGAPVYRPLGAERLRATLGGPAASDLKESLDFGPSLPGVACPSARRSTAS